MIQQNGSHWPEELQPFTFRWLHEHKAYQIHHSSDHVRNFVAALKKQIGLSPVLTPDQETKIYNKTHKYLSHWIKTWQQCGLLVLKGDLIARHASLEKALTIRRSEYIAVAQDGRLEGPGMLTPDKNRSQASLKRVRLSDISYTYELTSDSLVISMIPILERSVSNLNPSSKCLTTTLNSLNPPLLFDDPSVHHLFRHLNHTLRIHSTQTRSMLPIHSTLFILHDPRILRLSHSETNSHPGMAVRRYLPRPQHPLLLQSRVLCQLMPMVKHFRSATFQDYRREAMLLV